MLQLFRLARIDPADSRLYDSARDTAGSQFR
jgi:hypothetical protein